MGLLVALNYAKVVDRIGADYDLAACEPGDLDPHAVASVFKAYFRECKLIACLACFFGVNTSIISARAHVNACPITLL